jgi:hypothetical protein
MFEIWKRQQGETAKAYEAFRVYRDLGPVDRSQVKVGERGGKCRVQIERWSARYGWVERVRAYDAEIEARDAEEIEQARQKAREMLEKDREEMWQRQRQLSLFVQNLILERLQTLKPEDIPASRIPEFMERMFKLERQALGLDTGGRGNELDNAQQEENRDTLIFLPEGTGVTAQQVMDAI